MDGWSRLIWYHSLNSNKIDGTSQCEAARVNYNIPGDPHAMALTSGTYNSLSEMAKFLKGV